MSTGPDTHVEAERRLTAKGLRYTSNRRALVEALNKASDPMSIPDLIALMPGSSQSSVYRNLGDLVSAGVVARVQGTDEWARFELDDAFTGRHHHHIMCNVCGEVRDIDIPESLEHELESAFTDLATKSGYRITHHRVDLVGTCRKCH